MKIAVVTGVSSGMGRKVVIQITDHSGGIDEIWTIVRRKERLEELNDHVPATLRCFGLDVTDSDDLKVLEMVLKGNKPDMKSLINPIGYGKTGDVGDVCLENETGMTQVNCQALCAVTYMVLPYMGENSRILQFASFTAFLPQSRLVIYATTKSFVLSYSCALGVGLKNRSILVTAVCPGLVKTEFFDIAETTGHISLYKRPAMTDLKKVVRLTLWDSMMGKPLSAYGSTTGGSYVLSKTLPHSWLLYLMTHMKF